VYKKLNIDPSQVKEMYEKQLMSCEAIAKKLGCTKSTIFRILCRAGVQRRTYNKAQLAYLMHHTPQHTGVPMTAVTKEKIRVGLKLWKEMNL
jgi:IS30 family transposase